MVAMCFTSLPFVVRTVQPVLEDLDPALEEAAQTLGARPWQIFCAVILPLILPGFLAGVHARLRPLPRRVRRHHLHRRQPADGDRDHLAADLHPAGGIRLQAAAALASVLLITAFLMLVVTNLPRSALGTQVAMSATAAEPPRVGDSRCRAGADRLGAALGAC